VESPVPAEDAPDKSGAITRSPLFPQVTLSGNGALCQPVRGSRLLTATLRLVTRTRAPVHEGCPVSAILGRHRLRQDGTGVGGDRPPDRACQRVRASGETRVWRARLARRHGLGRRACALPVFG
jgi:hypothetical protein